MKENILEIFLLGKKDNSINRQIQVIFVKNKAIIGLSYSLETMYFASIHPTFRKRDISCRQDRDDRQQRLDAMAVERREAAFRGARLTFKNRYVRHRTRETKTTRIRSAPCEMCSSEYRRGISFLPRLARMTTARPRSSKCLFPLAMSRRRLDGLPKVLEY